MHRPSSHRRTPLARRVSLASAVLGASLLFVRPALAGEAPDRAGASGGVVTLPEFSVNDSDVRNEWVASQALTGTRTAAPVIELPYQVQVITKEFLSDFQLFSLTNQMTFFTGFSGGSDLADPAIGGSGQAGNMLRGFPVTIIRDGFVSNGYGTPPPTISNTEAVENISGPISVLYGDAQPGGVINYITKRPSLSPIYSLTLSGGSYDYFRCNLYASGPLVGNSLYFLVSADNSYRKSRMQYTYARTGDYLFSLLWKPAHATSLKVTYERVRLIGARAASMPSLLVGTKLSPTNPLSWSGGINTGLDWDLARVGYSRFGPGERYFRNYDAINALFEHAYNAIWKQRINYSSTWKHFDLLYRTNSNVSAETGRMTGVQPNRRVQTIIAPNNAQTDLLGEFRDAPVKQALLFTAGYTLGNTRDNQLRLPTNLVAQLPASYTYQDPNHPDWTPFDYSLLTRVGSKNYENLSEWGAGVSDRFFFDRDRLIVLVTGRYDNAHFKEDSSTTKYEFTPGHDDAWTYSYGANYKLLGNSLVVFLNRSTSFNSNPTIDANTGTTIPNERGRGTEIGLKSLSDDQRIGMTVSVYQNEKNNIGQDNPAYVLGNGEPQYLGTGTNRVRGIDGNFNVQVGPGLIVKAGASYLDARVMSSTNAALVHTRMTLVPRTTGSLAANYKFAGALKGLRLGAAFRYTGSFVRTNPSATTLYTTSAPRQLVDTFISYAWKAQRLTHSVSLNAGNLFDKFYVGPDLGVGLGRNINVTYKLEFK